MSDAPTSSAPTSSAPTSTTSPPPTTRRLAPEKGAVVMGWNRVGAEVGASFTTGTSAPTVSSEPERHLDAGQLGRSPSGRLPPAYGEQGV